MSNYDEIDEQDEPMEVIDVDVEDTSKDNEEVKTIIEDNLDEMKVDEPIQILDDEPKKSEEMVKYTFNFQLSKNLSTECKVNNL